MNNNLSTHLPSPSARGPRRGMRRKPVTTAEIPYTWSEQYLKKYTVNDAVRAARVVLDGYSSTVALCVNRLGKPLTTKISLKELNEIAERLVSDSLQHGI